MQENELGQAEKGDGRWTVDGGNDGLRERWLSREGRVYELADDRAGWSAKAEMEQSGGGRGCGDNKATAHGTVRCPKVGCGVQYRKPVIAKSLAPVIEVTHFLRGPTRRTLSTLYINMPARSFLHTRQFLDSGSLHALRDIARGRGTVHCLHRQVELDASKDFSACEAGRRSALGKKSRPVFEASIHGKKHQSERCEAQIKEPVGLSIFRRCRAQRKLTNTSLVSTVSRCTLIIPPKVRLASEIRDRCK